MTLGHQEATFLRRLRTRLPRMRWAVRKLIDRNPPKGDVYYGDMAALYDEERQASRRWHREQAAVAAYLEQLPAGLDVLDVPLGTGRFLPLYFARGHRVTGFDASDEMLAVARRRAGARSAELTLEQGDATRLPYPDAAFGLVVSTRFLRHVLPFDQARRALAEMARVSNAHAIIEMGCTDRASSWPEAGKPIRDRINHGDLLKLFSEAGFDMVGETPTTGRYLRFGRGRRRLVFLLRKRGGSG